MRDYETRILSVVVLPEGEAIFCEEATTIEIVDDAAGEYIVVSQERPMGEHKSGSIAFEPREWTQIRSAIDDMMAKLRG